MFKKALSQNDLHDYVEARLSAYIDGRLPEEERGILRKHLMECERCSRNLNSLGWTIKLLKEVPAPALPRQFTLRVPEPKPRPAAFGWFKWGLAAASAVGALAIVLVLATSLISFGGPPSQAFAPVPPASAPTRVAIVAPASVPETGPATAEPNVPAAESLDKPPTAEPTAVPIQPSLKSTSRSAATPAATPTCSNGCGGAAPSAPPGMGGGAPFGFTPRSMTSQPTSSQPVFTTGVVTGALVLNVRAGPSVNSAELGTLARKTAVQIIARDVTGDWLEILYPPHDTDGLVGWVSAKYITLSVRVSDIPFAEPTVTPTSTSNPDGVNPSSPPTSTPTPAKQ